MKVENFEMESGLQVYIEKGWWVEFPLESPWASPGKPCESDVRIEQQEMMKEQAGLRKSGRGLGKVGGAYGKYLGKSGRGLAKVGGA